MDAGAAKIWDGAEPLGLMTFDEQICSYTLVIVGLKRSFDYKWKVTVNNLWAENYGCGGTGDCVFKSNSEGAIRFLVKPTNFAPQLTTDFNVAECGDNVCEPGESCQFCPQDCGECPPPVCGDGVCEGGETFVSCPEDCNNELPGCDRFNDESCRSGSQFNANPGVEKRRWQTPKPGAKNYQASYQDFHSLVGYGDIRYTSPARTEADVCIVIRHKSIDSVKFEYFFNEQAQAENCKRFSTSHKSEVDKIKLWDGLYPKEPHNNPAPKNRVVIQNDDHDQQNPG